MRIPLFRPRISEEAIEGVGAVLRSGWLGLEKKTRAFEEAFASYLGIPYSVGLNSCTSALHLALHLLELAPGSEIITTALTFVSTNHVIQYERCVPVFADIQADTGNLDVKARYKGKRVGSHGDLHAFSFHAVKNLPMGDGGALTVRLAENAERLRRLRWLGIDANVLGVSLLQYKNYRTSSFHLFAILVEDRDALAKKLTANDVESFGVDRARRTLRAVVGDARG